MKIGQAVLQIWHIFVFADVSNFKLKNLVFPKGRGSGVFRIWKRDHVDAKNQKKSQYLFLSRFICSTPGLIKYLSPLV